MIATCEHLEPVVSRAMELGVAPIQESSGWSGEVRRVVHMSESLPQALRPQVASLGAPLRYYLSEGSPHTEPDEGLVCVECGVGLSFPRAGA